MKPWLNIIRFSLLPALSASGATAAFDVELWHLLKHLPYMTRYNLYAEWRDATCAPGKPMSCPVAVPAAEASTKGVRDALRRVVAPGGGGVVDRGPARSLAKLSHTNPQALWSTAVHQVRNYSNIGQFIVEAGRYMTQLSTDVAAFTLLDGLANPPKGTRMTNENGTDVALWLSSEYDQLESVLAADHFRSRYVRWRLQPTLRIHGPTTGVAIHRQSVNG
jgi:THO complex subunit 2